MSTEQTRSYGERPTPPETLERMAASAEQKKTIGQLVKPSLVTVDGWETDVHEAFRKRLYKERTY